MIPYFELRTLPIAGGLSLAVFGTLVGAGLFAGVLFAESRARALGIPERHLHAAIAWAVVPGLVTAHLVALGPQLYRSAPWSPWLLLDFWNGMSSFGGFAGALLGLALGYRGVRASWLAVAEILVQALVVGWMFGRLGCTLVHDHVGTPSDFWLAIRFPDGPRHDLGFYELLYTTLVLLPAVIVLNRRARPPGATIAWIALLYAPARFLGDFLRNTDLPQADARYLGLTVAQYGCLALTAVGLGFAGRLCRRAERPA
jgi:phosphatidylglycerol:prolipoprotein diacylglycerol transferase